MFNQDLISYVDASPFNVDGYTKLRRDHRSLTPKSQQPITSLSLVLHSSMEIKKLQLHFVLVPLMAQGHMIPMVDMAHLLAHRGATVSLVTTPVNASRIRPVIDRVAAAGLPIRFVELRFPGAEVGLPEGCESFDQIEAKDQFLPFFEGLRLLREPLQLYLKAQLQPGVSTCMISDMCLPWTAAVASELKIPRFVFHGPSCFFLLCVRNVEKHGLCAKVDDEEPFLVPDLPGGHRIYVPKSHAWGFFGYPGLEKLREEAAAGEAAADGVVINTFEELEPEFITAYEKAIQKRALAIGPLSLRNKGMPSQVTRGNKASIESSRLLGWLDPMKPGSVLYVSFGSMVRIPLRQLVEIGLGLEAAGRPFIWAVKEVAQQPEVERWLSEEFEERVSGRGLVIRGWAPQVLILSHPGVGGFVTHCGWNSTLEAVSAGVPMITWPHVADQFLNEKHVVEVLGVGVSLGVKVTVYNLEGDGEVVVVRGELEAAVRRLMGGEEGREMRRRARELGEKARTATERGGSSYQNLQLLIDYALNKCERDGGVCT